jgi:hypothetical protein
MQKKAWAKEMEPFIGDLRIPEDRLLDYNTVRDAYSNLVGAQLGIARGIGFQPGWKYAS